MFYHRRMINHFTHINQWLAQNEGQANLDMRTFEITLTSYGRIYKLEPQFLYEAGSMIAYTPTLTPDVNGFIGWLPYRGKRWPLSHDKVLFKKYIEQNGKRTPQYWVSPDSFPENVLIKPATGSFGNGQRGPFKKIDPLNLAHLLAPGEFYEKFRAGTILKVWYWNDKPICVECRPALYIEGDGQSTVADLIKHTYPLWGKALRRYEMRRNALTALLAYQDVSWETVLPEKTRILADYLYGSTLHPEMENNANQLNAIRGTPFERELIECGTIFWRAIPEDIRMHTAYAMDGIIDDTSGEIRWLEMNSNPMFPPDAYSTVLDSLFKE